MVQLHFKSDKKLWYGALVFAVGITLSVITFFISNSTSDIRAYLDKITIPIFMSLAFIGLSLCIDGFFENTKITSPTLNAIILLEEIIKKEKLLTKIKLLQLMRKKLTLSDKAFILILDYLENSNKIHIDKKDEEIAWIWNPKGVGELLKKGLLIK